MPIIVVLVVLVAVIYGAFWSFHAISAALGLGIAIGAAIVAGLIVAAAAAFFWFRWKEVAPNARDGDWTHEVKEEWGGVRVAAGKGLCEIRVNESKGMYIFADLRGARMEPVSAQGVPGHPWQVVLDVADAIHAQWILPMRDRREAHKWSRILQKATDEKL